jgi:hypothetical protein
MASTGDNNPNCKCDIPPEVIAYGRKRLWIRWSWIIGSVLVVGLAIYGGLTIRQRWGAKPPIRTDTDIDDAASTVIPEPVRILREPEDVITALGKAVTVFVGVTGTPPIHVQWRLNGELLIGATNTALTIYTRKRKSTLDVTVSNEYGIDISRQAELKVFDLPRILKEPVKHEVDAGDSLVLEPELDMGGASDAAMTWLKDGVPLKLKTSKTLMLSSIQPSDAGAYSLVISNAVGMVTGLVAHVQIKLDQPTIIRQPASQEVAEGGAVTLSVLAKGSGPIRYQWVRNNQSIVDANLSELTITNITLANAGEYQALVSNPNDLTVSQTAMIRVISKSVTTPPKSPQGIAAAELARLPAMPTYLLPISMSAGSGLMIKSPELVAAMTKATAVKALVPDGKAFRTFPLHPGTDADELKIAMDPNDETKRKFYKGIEPRGELDTKAGTVTLVKTNHVAVFWVNAGASTNLYVAFHVPRSSSEIVFPPIQLSRSCLDLDANLVVSVKSDVVQRCTNNVMVDRKPATWRMVVDGNPGDYSWTFAGFRESKLRLTKELAEARTTERASGSLYRSEENPKARELKGLLRSGYGDEKRAGNIRAFIKDKSDYRYESGTGFDSDADDVGKIWQDYVLFVQQSLKSMADECELANGETLARYIRNDVNTFRVFPAALDQIAKEVSHGKHLKMVEFNRDKRDELFLVQKRSVAAINSLRNQWAAVFTDEMITKIKECLGDAPGRFVTSSDIQKQIDSLPNLLPDIKSIQIQIQIGNQWIPFIEFKDLS